jgi:hypothetical protein
LVKLGKIVPSLFENPYFTYRMKKLLIFFAFACFSCAQWPEPNDNLVENLMLTEPNNFQNVLENRDQLEIQIIYTQIDRDENNLPSFRSFYYNVDSNRYFYPASTVKLPLCLLALEKINQLNIDGLDKFTPMFHDSVYVGQLPVLTDSSSESKLPSVAHYIKKVLTVSDNDGYNRLYEFIGQKETNEILKKKGYNVRLLHRLERALSPDQNRHTERVRFVKDNKVVFEQPMLVNEDSIAAPAFVLKGKGFFKNDSLVQNPFDFTYKNFYSLTDQHQLLRAVLFPETVNPIERFNLTVEDYKFIHQYMSQLPTETTYPAYYRDTNYHDAKCKFFLYGAGKEKIQNHIRIFNKVGNAYGFLIDNAYVVDFKNGVEFMLSAVIHVNTDEIYNDGKYDYDSIGYPFMKNLGQLIHRYELDRPRQNKPDLSKFVIKYDHARQ